MKDSIRELQRGTKCMWWLTVLFVAVPFGSAVAQTDPEPLGCAPGTIEIVIEVAGEGESVAYDAINDIAALPTPLPKPAGKLNFIARRFATIANGTVDYRSLLLKGNSDAVEAQFDVLLQFSQQINDAIDKLAALPTPTHRVDPPTHPMSSGESCGGLTK